MPGLHVDFLLFCRRFCSSRVSDVPTKTAKTSSFSQNNPGFQELSLRRRETIEADEASNPDQDPVYCHIPALQHDYANAYENAGVETSALKHDYENANVGFRYSHYQPLDVVNGTSDPTYAGLSAGYDQSEL